MKTIKTNFTTHEEADAYCKANGITAMMILKLCDGSIEILA